MKSTYDVIIIGGSYAGLQAALTLARALRRVLLIDSGLPCNRSTPHAHNFLSRDGETPAQLRHIALEQLACYPTVKLLKTEAITVNRAAGGFTIGTTVSENHSGRKLLFATGIRDMIPDIKGFAECWGKSVIHCPYCHGYEVRQQVTGLLANGEVAFEMANLLSNWTSKLTIFTNGVSRFTTAQQQTLAEKDIAIIADTIQEMVHQNGSIEYLLMSDGTRMPLKTLYARVPFVQHCPLPEELGCSLTEEGYIQISPFQKTTIEGVYAAGDNTNPMRAIAAAAAGGMAAGAFINKELIEENLKEDLRI